MRCQRQSTGASGAQDGKKYSLERRELLAMLGAALAMSHSDPASADATDEEAVANKELVKEVVDKTKPAAEGRSCAHHEMACNSSYRRC